VKLKKQFEDFHKLISVRRSNIGYDLIEKRNTLEIVFGDKFPDICKNDGIFINKSNMVFIDQGSYKIGTIIKSPPNGSIDRDVAVIFPLDINEHNDPRVLKKHAKTALEIKNKRVPRIKEPCVTVSYFENGKEWLHIDFPMYAEYNGKLYLARGKETSLNYTWEESDPKGLNSYFENRLKDNAQLKRIIRYIKKWKMENYSSTGSKGAPPSVGLTILACTNFVESKEGNSYDDLTALYKTMERILRAFAVSPDYNDEVTSATINCNLPVMPFTDVFNNMSKSNAYGVAFYKRWKKAVESLQNACNVDSEHEAAKYVQKALGDAFDIPPKEAVQTMSTLGKRETNFG